MADAPAIAQVYVTSLRTTYRGIVPDAVLDNLSQKRRERYVHDVLSDFTSQKCIYVAEDDGGHIIGIVSGGPVRDSELRYRSELYMIYLLQAAQRQGIGRMLIAAVAQHLSQQQLSGIIIWVLVDTPRLSVL